MRTRCGPPIISYLRMKVHLSNIVSLILELELLLHMHVFVCASVCEFRGRNSFKGEECKTRENYKFSKMGK